MNRERLFEFLETCDPSALLNLLSAAYDDMDHDQRRVVFGPLIKAQPPALVDGQALLAEVEEFNLISAMERGEKIVFGDEIGGWMIPGDEQQILAAYMTSLAAVATPAEFAAVALPLIERDWQSLSDQVYASAVHVASESQRLHLEAEIQRLKVKTGRPARK